MSKYVVKLYVVDFVCGLGLESLQNDGVLFAANLHSEVVENRLETGEGDEARAALILVLEVWLDEEASVLDISAKPLEATNQHLLLSVVKNVFRVEDGWRVENTGSLCWVLLKSYIGENGLQLAA